MCFPPANFSASILCSVPTRAPTIRGFCEFNAPRAGRSQVSRARLQAGAKSLLEWLLQLCDLVLHHFHSRRMFHNFRTSMEQRWTSRNLNWLANYFSVHSHHWFHDVGIGFCLSDIRWNLLVGCQTRWSQSWLLHRLAQSHRSFRSGRFSCIQLRNVL